jgi:8-oxo-dGTP pyrophosphatase MutT (NUDIX family)
MIFTLQVSDEFSQGNDFKEVTVVSESRLESLLKRSVVDGTFQPVFVAAQPYRSLELESEFLQGLVQEHQGNVIACLPNGYQIYRIREQKRPGRDYPGIGVGVIILNECGEVAMLKRNSNTNNCWGKWEIPGGTVEKGQSIFEAGRIEVEQETGLKVRILGCISIYEHWPNQQHWNSYTLVAHILDGELRINEPTKFDACGYFHPSVLPEETTELTKQSLQDWMRRRHGTEYLPIGCVKE